MGKIKDCENDFDVYFDKKFMIKKKDLILRYPNYSKSVISRALTNLRKKKKVGLARNKYWVRY
ncbi:MAG: hypothetical protein ACOCP8_04345 [archaeon]